MSWIFWCSLAFLGYTFVGYRTLLWMLSRRYSRLHRRASIYPEVSLIVAVHNAGNVIREKLANALALDYPQEKFEIIVASDASNDDTAAIVRTFADQGVRLVEIPHRRGKGHAEMTARNASRGEILVFTDASALLEPSSLRRMVENFADPSVGVVSSNDLMEARSKDGAGETSYTQGEMGLRCLESSVSSLVSVSGCFFGARRQICDVWDTKGCSDFFVPLHAVSQGFRVVMDPDCRARVRAVGSRRAEFRRKVRTIVQGLDVFFSHLTLLNPFRYGVFSWQLVSHKLFRWLLPFGFAALLLSNIALYQVHPMYRLFLVLQLAGYGAGLLALVLENRVDLTPLRLAEFFLLGYAATLVAWLDFSLGETYVIWEPSRRA